jgi:hypothetical protein
MPEDPKPKIYCWVNSGHGTDMQLVMAMAEDGHCLASHLSSSEDWAKHDIGHSHSDWKHGNYTAHYPGGWETEWIPDAEVRTHQGLNAAYARNQLLKEDEEAHDETE